METFKENWKRYTEYYRLIKLTKEEMNKYHFEEWLQHEINSLKGNIKNLSFKTENNTLFKVEDIKYTIDKIKKTFTIIIYGKEKNIISVFNSLNVPENLYKSLFGSFTFLSDEEYLVAKRKEIEEQIKILQSQLKSLK